MWWRRKFPGVCRAMWGRFFTTEDCDGCAYCASIAPENFDYQKETNTYFVSRQPRTTAEEDEMLEALEDCRWMPFVLTSAAKERYRSETWRGIHSRSGSPGRGISFCGDSGRADHVPPPFCDTRSVHIQHPAVEVQGRVWSVWCIPTTRGGCRGGPGLAGSSDKYWRCGDEFACRSCPLWLPVRCRLQPQRVEREEALASVQLTPGLCSLPKSYSWPRSSDVSPGDTPTVIPFCSARIPSAVLERVSGLAEGTDVIVVSSTDGDRNRRIAEVVSRGDRELMGDANYRRNISAWLHTYAASHVDGLPAQAFGFEGKLVTIAPWATRVIDIGKIRAAHDRTCVSKHPD